jgi:hypothetical protein
LIVSLLNWSRDEQIGSRADGYKKNRFRTTLREKAGVPPELAGCYAAEVEGYIVEGHVPAAAIHRLLQERPKAVGLSVPGMPPGSPGMDGPAVRYAAILFGENFQSTFMQFEGATRVN